MYTKLRKSTTIRIRLKKVVIGMKKKQSKMEGQRFRKEEKAK